MNYEQNITRAISSIIGMDGRVCFNNMKVGLCHRTTLPHTRAGIDLSVSTLEKQFYSSS